MFNRLQAMGCTALHLLDHPSTLKAATQVAHYAVLPLGSAALLAHDVLEAPNKTAKKKVLVRDLLVLGATLLGNVWAANRYLAPHAEKILKPILSPEGLQALEARYGSWAKGLVQENLGQAPLSKVFSSVKRLFQEAKPTATEQTQLKTFWQGVVQDVETLIPVDHSHHTHAEDFFKAGGVSVLSGMLGGLVANRLLDNDHQTKVSIIKEGIFQFIANIALCAAGAKAGLTLVEALETKSKVARLVIVLAGLSVGIFGGGHLANYVGAKLVNPIMAAFKDKTQNASDLEKSFSPKSFPQESSWWQRVKHHLATAFKTPYHASRDLEFADVILHLDDIPTAAAMAGAGIFEPFIAPFFAFSGFRTGIGYQNQPDNKDHLASAHLAAGLQRAAHSASGNNLTHRFGRPEQAQVEATALPFHGASACERAKTPVFQFFYEQQQNRSLLA